MCGRETGFMTETPTIPGYRVDSRLGQGGMATVYLAIQQSFEREVALKVMSPLLNSDPSFAARFKREAHIVAQLNHASIVPVFDVGEHQSYHYLSMEYLPAGDLKRRILDRERNLNLALKVCMALCAALEIAHRKGFIHRDIKPENILFREDGTPVLTDFGIARALDSGRSMTMAGMLVGTPDYMSPEQVKGLELDGRSDLYSVGVVFYEILTGSVPFKSDSALSVALKQVGEPLPPLPPEYAEYQEFLNCLTAKDREERFASGAEVVRALRLLSVGRSGRDRALVRSVTPTRGLSGSPTTGTQLPPSNPTPAPDETYVSQPTLARLRMAGASRGSADPQNPTLVEGGVEGPTGLSAAEPGYADQESSIVSNPPSPVVPDGAVIAAADSRTISVPDRQLWLAAAAITVVIACVGLVFFAKPDVVTREPASRQPRLDTQSAVPVGSPQALAAQTTPSALPTGVRTRLNASAEQTTATQTFTRHKLMLAERRQRKAEEARLAAEARAAQLAAQETRIQDLLTAAKTQYRSGALWQPAGSSAADSYRAILTMQPQRAEALAGAQRLANVLADEAEDAEASGNLDSSKQLIDQVQSLQPTHPKLPELQARFQQLQSSPTALDARNRSRLERAAKYIARAAEDLDRRPLDFKAVDDATDQYDRALSTAPKAPGLPSLQERLVAAYPTAVQTALDLHDTKRAQKLIVNAHKHNWSSPELDQLETTLQSDNSSDTAGRGAGAR